MSPREIIRMALRALARNRMRTILTMLGIVIGVAAVIITVGIGQGAGQEVQRQIQSLGTNMMIVFAGNVNRGGVRMGSEATKTLTPDDAQAIEQRIPTIVAVSPGASAQVQIVYQSQNWATRAQGASAAYFQIRDWPVVEGSTFSKQEVDTAANVCVIGHTVATHLFGTQDPVGKIVRIQKDPFRVIGLLATKGESTFGRDQDDTIIMPYTTVQKKIAGISWLQTITAEADTRADIPVAEQEITALLRQRHKLRADAENDFSIRSPDELTQAVSTITRILTLLLGGIASVSLLVGGIGIMNIMLVTVTERTHEIGIRKAVGATEEDIRRQFLSEAVVLSCLGGLAGIVLGLAGSMLVSRLLHWPPLLSPLSVLIAVIFSAAVGIFFGYYPARQASRLDPIDALRYE